MMKKSKFETIEDQEVCRDYLRKTLHIMENRLTDAGISIGENELFGVVSRIDQHSQGYFIKLINCSRLEPTEVFSDESYELYCPSSDTPPSVDTLIKFSYITNYKGTKRDTPIFVIAKSVVQINEWSLLELKTQFGERSKLERDIARLENQKEKLKGEISTLKCNKKNLQDTEKSLTDAIKRIDKEAKDRLQYYKKLGVIAEAQSVMPSGTEYHVSSYDKLIDQVWGYLWKTEKLYYENATVRAFMNSLRTKQLTLLWGRPGTGKTSMPIKVAEAIGAKCVRIQVQSNWTDNQDLLGFFNVVDQRYISTQFLDALVEAEKNPKQLYLILLDEMNLSNVEYYFSEMLNAFTWDKPYELQLYSERIRQRAQEELNRAEQAGQNIDDIVAQLADMDYYKPSFAIPENVRFVGTLNTDATTKTISPKVIDRSYLIELQTTFSETLKKQEETLPEIIELDGNDLYVPADIFHVAISDDDTVSELEDAVIAIREMGLPVSNRVNMYIRQWPVNTDSKAWLDEIILGKILPAIDWEYTSRSKERKLIEQFEKSIDGCTRSLIKLQRMKELAKDSERLRYWEN